MRIIALAFIVACAAYLAYEVCTLVTTLAVLPTLTRL